MREIEALLNKKTVDAQRQYEASTNAPRILRSLANTVQGLARAAVDEANQVDDVSEKLVTINKCLIQIVQLCEATAGEAFKAGVVFEAEVQLLAELLKSLQAPEEEISESEMEDPQEEISDPQEQIAHENSPEDN